MEIEKQQSKTNKQKEADKEKKKKQRKATNTEEKKVKRRRGGKQQNTHTEKKKKQTKKRANKKKKVMFENSTYSTQKLTFSFAKQQGQRWSTWTFFFLLPFSLFFFFTLPRPLSLSPAPLVFFLRFCVFQALPDGGVNVWGGPTIVLLWL